MPLDPAPDDGGKFPDLRAETAIFPRRDADRVLIQPDLRAAIRRIEMPIDPHLAEEVYCRTDLGIDEERQARIEKWLRGGVDQAWRRQIKGVELRVQRAAQPRTKAIVQRADGKSLIEPIDECLRLRFAS